MYGFQVPRDYEQAVSIDEDNKNTKWQDSTRKNSVRLMNMRPSMTKGKDINLALSTEDTCTSHLRCQHDGRHKARLVAGGHLTETPIDSVYSSVVSLRGIRIVTFLSELNGCETWSTDVSCAYLESYTQEKVYIVAGPEFDHVRNT
jgi:hypothetical protein